MLLFVSIVFSSLIAVSGIISLTFNRSNVTKYVIFFISLIIEYTLSGLFPSLTVFFIGILFETILWALLMHSVFHLCVYPIVYIVICITINLVVSLYSALFALSPEVFETRPALMVLAFISTYVISELLFILLGRACYNRLATLFRNVDRLLFSLIALGLFFCMAEVFTLINYLGVVNITSSQLFIIVAIFISFIIIMSVIVIVAIKINNSNISAKRRIMELTALEEYTHNLESVYNKLRAFKHDYINIISSMSAYIDGKQYDELESFFRDSILPISSSLSHDSAAINNLDRIKVLPLKSILYSKLVYAVNFGIDVTIDIPAEINDVNMDVLDLVRVMGIFLDNAIEAALETDSPFLSVHIGEVGNGTMFMVRNNYKDHGLHISDMKKQGISSKGNARGFGLPNAMNIINKYSSSSCEIAKDDGSFTVSIFFE